MAKWATKMQRTASAVASLGAITAAAASPRRAKIYDVIIGSEGAAADNPFLWTFQRVTAAGTAGSAFTPVALDPGDTLACTIVVGQAHTIEPTYTANAILLDISLNQRATFRWVAAPGGELMIPATASNGVGIQTPTSAAVSITSTVHIDEQ